MLTNSFASLQQYSLSLPLSFFSSLPLFLSLHSDFGIVSQFSDSSSAPSPSLCFRPPFLALALLTFTTVLLRPLFSQRYFLYAFYICHTLCNMHSAHLIVIATVSGISFTTYPLCKLCIPMYVCVDAYAYSLTWTRTHTS